MPGGIAVHEYSNGCPTAQETNMIRTFAQIVLSGTTRSKLGRDRPEDAAGDRCALVSARQDNRDVAVGE